MTGRAPQVRRVNMLSEYRDPDTYTGGTRAFFRALSEADGFIHEAERGAEALVRVDELTTLVGQIRQLHRPDSPGDIYAHCGHCIEYRWPCPTMQLIEGK
jgi:hypothetical protein